MTLTEDIFQHSNGAQFVRADLHLHSYGQTGSYDVKDAAMTPEAIVDAALMENLQVISITDHNSIGNVRRAVEYSNGKDVLVVPGVELSTPQGHLLVYFETSEQLDQFHGKLNITADKKACHNGMAQCLQIAHEFGGFGICAHVDQQAGLEVAHAKYDAFKQEILNQKNLLALEITDPNNATWFSHTDGHADRKNCAHIRRQTLDHETDVSLAKVMGSDSHALATLGRNARGDKRLSRFKMETLSFDALRVALLDCAARVRLEELIPAAIPHFVGMKLEGGFLKDQTIHFSRNLTCIIGGRGAGKSTLLESLRITSGCESTNTIIDSEVWPDCISLIYEDEVGQQHQLTRTKLGELTNANPNGPLWIATESYGQGETAATIHNCDKDPKILLAFLDGFLNLQEMQERDEAIRGELLESQKEIEALEQDIKRIPEIEQLKKTADGQVAALKTQRASEVVALEGKLAAERTFRDSLKATLAAIPVSVADGLNADALKNLIEAVDGDGLAVGKAQFQVVSNIALGLCSELEKVSTEARAKVKIATDQIHAQLIVWINEQQKTRDQIENIRRELEKQKIKLDMGFIRKVTADASNYAAKLAELKKSVPKQEAAYKARGVLINERRELKAKICATRQGFATKMNENLAECVVDYTVTLKYREGVLSPELEELIKGAMGWRTSQVPKAALVAQHLSPLALYDVIDSENAAPLLAITDSNGNKVFSSKDATDIINKLNEWDNWCALQRCLFEDRPEIRVTKMMDLPNGKRAPSIKDFSKLSLGQQQSILLTILLFSQSTAPLIIDQPEDNLDSEFVYTTLVRSLRSIKERRQVIVVTHNANIAVLGDAELIIPLRAASDVSVIRDRGSIDTPETKNIVCTILEGSAKAFLRRKALYGY